MKAVGITGAQGFFGWHLRCRLHALRPDLPVALADRATFADPQQLDRFVSECFAVVHLAGANRGDDDEVHNTNVGLAEQLVEALERTGRRQISVVFADTTHRNRVSAYGRAKRRAATLLGEWVREADGTFADLVFPNLFGECGRPYYNSAVATFCHQLSRGEPSQVNRQGTTELLHVQNAAARVLEALDERTDDEVRVEGIKLSVGDLYDRLAGLARDYGGQHFPRLESRLDLQLFNTLRSYLFPTRYPMKLTAHEDLRGRFFEVARGHGQTQVSFSTTKPGITRGDHYHLDKVERFVVISGEATIKLRRLFDEEVLAFHVSGAEPAAVDMPTLYAHNITNTGSGDLLTAFWTNDHFDPDAPETYPEVVGG